MTAAPPRPVTRAAAPRRRILAQAGFETSTLLRNGEQLLVSIVLPALVLLALHATESPSLGPGERIDVAVPGVIGELSSALICLTIFGLGWLYYRQGKPVIP